ncbi:MAG: glycosyltransferase [Anaerolineales bacterium]
MRVLYAGHTYLVNENQKKLAALARLPDVQIKAIVPHLWREPVLKEVRPHIPAAAAFELHPIRVLFPGNEMRYLYLSRDLHMHAFCPDLIVVENGAGAFAYTQFLAYRARYAPRARAVFFTWWNIPYRPRQPFRAFEQFNLRRTDGAIAGNQEAAEILRANGYAGPLLVLPQLGVDEHVFAPRDGLETRSRLGLNSFVIGYAGRLVPEKGLRVLMDALRGFRGNFDLLVLGRGPLEAELRAWQASLSKGQRLHLRPSVPHTEIAAYMNAMDVFVLPSLTTSFWKEQFGHVLIEAMACGVATVGSDSAEVPRVIGDAGCVTPEGDADALRATLQNLAARPDRRRELGARGRERVLAHYTHERIAQRTYAFFKSLPARTA